MSHRLAVYVYSADLISQAGTATQLRGRPEVYVVEQHAIDDAEVAVVVVDRLDDELRRLVGAIQRDGCPKVIVVATDVTEGGTDSVVGISAVMPRAAVTPESLTRTIVTVAAGRAEVPAAPTGALVASASPFDDRERDVLALLAEGFDTQAIAEKLFYSERTIKSVIHDITTRLNLRNRSHAVAYAIKAGVL
ncbi:MAG: LuxR C-terminal-related transcriptional regulator [Ilumatobacteraceae bacterium]